MLGCRHQPSRPLNCHTLPRHGLCHTLNHVRRSLEPLSVCDVTAVVAYCYWSTSHRRRPVAVCLANAHKTFLLPYYKHVRQQNGHSTVYIASQ